jgi:hypothetical protein
MTSMAATPFSSSPNPFYPNNPSEQHEPLLDWQLALMNNQLFTLTDGEHNTSCIKQIPRITLYLFVCS